MPEMEGSAMLPPPLEKQKYLQKCVWVAVGVAAVIGALWYFLYPSTFPFGASKTAPSSLIISLEGTVKDAQGIPYSGAVLYDPATKRYSYIATEDEGLVTPLDSSAFSSNMYYLAMRAGTDSSELVLYNYETLSLVRVIRELPIGALVTSAIWSPDGRTFAYRVAGIDIPALVIENVDLSPAPASPGLDSPISFSPDSSKILTLGTSTPVILHLADGSVTQTTGVAVTDAQTKFSASPSGKYLLVILEKEAEWYAIDWETATLSSLGTISLPSEVADILFAPDDSLIVREEGGSRMWVYSYEPGKGVKKSSSFKLSLPENASILHVVSW